MPHALSDSFCTPLLRSTALASLPALCALAAACSGTEADNPLTDNVGVSPCKGEEDYVEFKGQVDSLNAMSRMVTPADQRTLLSTAGPAEHNVSNFVSAGEHLVDPAEGPIWLECVEWHLQGQTLEVQNLNFRAGCGAEWVGGSRYDSGELLIHLDNSFCALAACGNCTYDIRTSLELDTIPDDLRFSIETDAYCDGDVQAGPSWSLPLGDQPFGISCRVADTWGAQKAFYEATKDVMSYLYAVCADGDLADNTCDLGTECVDSRCLLPCSESSECPLDGALTCSDGYCKLPE